MCITNRELDNRVAEIRSLKTLKEETENAIKSLERDVIEYLTENKLAEYVGTDYKASYKSQTRNTLDKKRLEEDLGDLTDYIKMTCYNVLRIK